MSHYLNKSLFVQPLIWALAIYHYTNIYRNCFIGEHITVSWTKSDKPTVDFNWMYLFHMHSQDIFSLSCIYAHVTFILNAIMVGMFVKFQSRNKFTLIVALITMYFYDFMHWPNVGSELENICRFIVAFVTFKPFVFVQNMRV